MHRNVDLGWVLLGIASVACGRVWLEPLSEDIAPDAGVPSPGETDAGDEDAGTVLPTDPDGSLMPNVPVSDASVPIQDAGPADAGPPDAGAVDAGSPDAGARDAGTSSCGGTPAFGVCWYLASGTSCTQTCAPRGGNDPRAPSYVGASSQGGSLATCTQVLRALGRQGEVTEGRRSDGNGFGCHVWPDGRGGANWWLSSPAFTPTAVGADPPIQIACGCLR